MKTKEQIVNNWLPRYTGKALGSFGKYFLLTNYLYYVELFAKWNNVMVEGKDKNEIPTGALLLVSDQPMISSGIKTEVSDLQVTNKYAEIHLKIGIDSLREIKENGVSVKHLKF